MHRNVSQRGAPKTKIPIKRGQMKYKQLTIAENFPVKPKSSLTGKIPTENHRCRT
jgi:hypothetical protein